MKKKQVMLITGTSRGIGEYLAKHYLQEKFIVIGCSRKKDSSIKNKNFYHHCLDITNEQEVKNLFIFIRKNFGRLDILINNAGIASMNHSLLIPFSTVNKILKTNVAGTFLLSREAAKIMKLNKFGRIVNFGTIATRLKLEGEAAYVASKAATDSLTEILAREYAVYGITVNSVSPTPVKTDLIKGVPKKKLQMFLKRQTIKEFATPADITHVIDFFINKKSFQITGQIIFLGGV